MQRWVVKIGSALLTADGQGLDTQAIAGWVDQIALLRAQGIEVVLVSSGSVAAGMTRLGWTERPSSIHQLQAAAAVGQMGLVQTYENNFARHGLTTAQILLTHADLSNRQRYLNARSALHTLLDLGVLPIVNENDTVVTDEIRFGDNDTLGALVANLLEADLLVILTDQDGLFTANPQTDPSATLIGEAAANDPRLVAMAAGGVGALGRGGMATKVSAAKLAARSGAHTIILGGRIENALLRIAQGEALGTLLWPEQERIAARKQWLAGHLQTRGVLHLDAGAAKVLRNSGKSLLAVGVTACEGAFVRGDMVSCVDDNGMELARGLVNYGAEDAQKILGLPSSAIAATLGYVDEPELLNRDNLILV